MLFRTFFVAMQVSSKSKKQKTMKQIVITYLHLLTVLFI